MTILEALIQLRNDLKIWAANNLRVKVDKEDGKGLSSNDFTNEEKAKLATALSSSDIVNNLITDSADKPLSAAQGKALKTAIDSISGDIGDLGGGDMMKAIYDTNNNGIVDNAERLDGHTADYFATKTDIPGVADVIRYTEQTLTDEQKAQARENIGAVSFVDWDEADETSVSTIKNKPFGYVEGMIDVLPLGVYSFTRPNDETTDIVCWPDMFEYEDNAEYYVMFDDIDLGQVQPDQNIDIPNGQFYFSTQVLVIKGGNYPEGNYSVCIQRKGAVEKKLDSKWLNIQDEVFNGTNMSDPPSCDAVANAVSSVGQEATRAHTRIDSLQNKILNYITYVLTGNNTVTIIGCKTDISGDHIIPSTINGYPVTIIDDAAFAGCNNLTSIIIPNSVTTIGNEAFASCDGLTSIVIPEGVVSIGLRAFYMCSDLTSVTIPNSVTYIASTAFRYTNLTDVYYAGTEDEWNAFASGVVWGEGEATIHYNQAYATKQYVLDAIPAITIDEINEICGMEIVAASEVQL